MNKTNMLYGILLSTVCAFGSAAAHECAPEIHNLNLKEPEVRELQLLPAPTTTLNLKDPEFTRLSLMPAPKQTP